MVTIENSLINKLTRRLTEGLRSGDQRQCLYVIDEALDSRFSPGIIYTNIISPANVEIGNLWHKGHISIAHEHVSTQISMKLLDHVLDKSTNSLPNGLSAIVTSVQGDGHCLGAKMMSNLLSLDGWKVFYLGENTPADDIARLVIESGSKVVALSVTLDRNIKNAIFSIEVLKNLIDPPLVVLGGAAISENLLEFNEALVVSDPVSAVYKLRKEFCIGAEHLTLNGLLAQIGVKVFEKRKAIGRSQGQLAELAGVDKAYISLVENGKQNLTMGRLLRIAQALDISVSDLLETSSNL